MAIRLFRPTQKDLVARKVTELPTGLFAHKDYLARAPSSIADLTNQMLIGFDRNPGLIDAYRSFGLELFASNFAIRCDNDMAEINAVCAGIGIGPLHVGMATKWPSIEQVLPDLQIPSCEYWLACHPDVRHNKRIRVVMDFLASALKTPYKSV